MKQNKKLKTIRKVSENHSNNSAIFVALYVVTIFVDARINWTEAGTSIILASTAVTMLTMNFKFTDYFVVVNCTTSTVP